MGGKHSRDKGKRGEREVAQLLRIAGFDTRRGMQSRAGTDECDVEGTPYWIECKRGKRVNLRGAIRQAEEDTDGRPPVVIWRDDRAEWMVLLSLEEWARMAWRAKNGE
jgi:Holliday junction resolvase